MNIVDVLLSLDLDPDSGGQIDPDPIDTTVLTVQVLCSSDGGSVAGAGLRLPHHQQGNGKKSGGGEGGSAFG